MAHGRSLVILRALRRGLPWAAVFALAFAASWLGGGQSDDETWLLQVAARVAGGEVLYRDVFFGVTPLSAWLAGALVALFGSALWLIKVLAALAFTLQAAFGLRLGRQLGAPPGLAALVPVGLFALAMPGFADTGAVYTSLANAWLLLACSAALSAGVRAPRTPWLAGVALGLCLCTKQNIGVYAGALSALALCIGTTAGGPPMRARLASVAKLGGLALAVLLLCLLPVWWSGGLPRFIEYGFLNKTTYLQVASVDYFDGLREVQRHLLEPISRADLVAIARQGLVFLLPLAAALLLALALLRRGARRAVVVAAGVVATGLLGALPRADYHHVATAMAATLVGLAAALGTLTSTLRQSLRRGLVVLLMLACGVLAAAQVKHALYRLSGGELTTERHPGVGPMTLAPDHHAALRSVASGLREAAKRGPVFVLSGSAALYTRLAGVANPFPYDFPWITALGRKNGGDLIAAVESGALPQLCVGMPFDHPLAPRALLAYARERMDAERDLGLCTLYVRPGFAGHRRRLRLELRAYEAGQQQVFWDDGRGYREENSVRLPVEVDQRHYQVLLPPGPLAGLRWDPCEKTACLLEVQRVVLSEPGVPDRDLSDLSRWTRYQVLVTAHQPPRVWSLGSDPQLRAPKDALAPRGPGER